MGYPIVDLRRCGQDLHKYLRWLEQTLIEFLAGYEISASRHDGFTGVWVQQRKIASIGVGVRHWITMHGFALNVCGDLSPFAHIIPCGLSNVAMTSIEKEIGKSVTVVDAAQRFEDLIREEILDLRSGRETHALSA
jgi:lipoyl(octanoyl) transferase